MVSAVKSGSFFTVVMQKVQRSKILHLSHMDDIQALSYCPFNPLIPPIAAMRRSNLV